MRNKKKKAPFINVASIGAFVQDKWKKIIIIGGIAIIGVYSTSVYSLSRSMQNGNIDAAIALNPQNYSALTVKMNVILSEPLKKNTAQRLETLAKQTLRVSPLEGAAMQSLGFAADLRGNVVMARRYMQLSNSLSRRNLGTQMWLIEDAVRQDNVKSALVHYDIAMRVSTESWDMLTPTLVAALDAPDIRQDLLPILRQEPIWKANFLLRAIEAENPEYVSDILIKMRPLPKGEPYPTIANTLLARLLETDNVAVYRQYMSSLPFGNIAPLASVTFNKENIDPHYASTGWQLVNPAVIGSGFVPNAGRDSYSMSISAGSGANSVIATKSLLLSPRNYDLTAQFTSPNTAKDASVTVAVNCVTAKETKQLWNRMLPITKGKFQFQQKFVIAPECLRQTLNISVAGGSDQVGAEFGIDSMQLR